MPGSLLTPHDALSDRSEASYCSADSRASAKKVSFNRAVRVKQYPWTPDDNYLPEDGTTHLSLPSRRFWFKVYKVKPQNGDHDSRDQNSSSYNGHYSQQPHPATSFEGENAEDTYDSLAPIVEDDSTDHEDRSLQHSNGPFHRNQVKDTASKFSDEPLRRENGVANAHGYNSSRQTTTKNHVLNGFKAVLAKSQGKLKGEKKDLSSRSAPQGEAKCNYRAASPTKLSGISNSSFSRTVNPEKPTEVNDRPPNLPIKIPRAESPRRGRDGIERFSMRYKTNQRRSRSTGDTAHSESDVRRLTSTDKSVSTDDLDSHDKSGLSWLNRTNKDKSTQCNGTLLRSKPLTAYGTPRLSRSSFTNLLKREEPIGKTSHLAKTDAPLSSSRSLSLNGRTGDDNGNNRNSRSSSQYESSARSVSSDAKRNAIITKPRITLNSHRSQTHKTNALVANKEVCTNGEYSRGFAEVPSSTGLYERGRTNLNSGSATGDHSRGFAEVPSSTGLYERGRGLSVVPEERSDSRQHWSSNTPLTERRASSWERSIRPTAATVGYQSGRYIAPQRLRGENGVLSSYDTNQNGGDVTSPKARERRNRLTTSKTRDASRSSLQEPTQNGREFSNASTPLKNSSVSASGEMIDWSLSGFQLGPPTVDRGLASDSECFVHQRPPLLMYIPGVSHHEKRAVEEDRMSGVSGISRGDVDDDLRPAAGAANPYVFNRRNSLPPKDCNKSWVKWKVGGRPSRQP